METTFKILKKMGAPPAFSKEVMEQLAVAPPLPADTTFVPPSFTRAIKDKNGNRLPQTIAHRGYKAKFPENTMASFRGAVAAGTHALETDVHITKDGVVVLSHDGNLQRCFGVDKKVNQCEWKFLSEMRTTQAPHEPMPRLEDLLRYLAEPGLEKIWLLLDIKMDNDANEIMRLIASTLASVPAPPNAPWKWQTRIVLGCWAARFVPPALTHLPSYPLSNIGFNMSYSRQFLAVPHMSFNLLLPVLLSPTGRAFIAKTRPRNQSHGAKAQSTNDDDRAVYAWTVNHEKGMDWCIRQGLDGVITDDPRKFLDYCDGWDEGGAVPAWPWELLKQFGMINVFSWVFAILYWFGHGYGLEGKFFGNKKRRS